MSSFIRKFMVQEGGVSGASGGGPGSEDPENSNSGAGTGAEGGSTTPSGDSGSDAKPLGDGETISKTDFDALMQRMQAADRRASQAEQKLREAEDAKKDKLDIVERDLNEARAGLEKLGSENKRLRIQLAILSEPAGYTWHDSRDVLRVLAEDDSIAISDDGKVSGVRAALDRLAKEKPFWLKTAAEQQKEGQTANGGASGSGAAGRGSAAGKDSAAEREAKLRNKFRIHG